MKNTKTLAQFAKTINAAHARMRKAVFTESIFAGEELQKAKEQLPHGEFEKMILENLDFTSRQARRYMAIASCPQISNRTHVSDLPASMGTLAEIATLSEDEFNTALNDGIIHQDMDRKDITAYKKELKRDEKITELAEATAAATEELGIKQYNVLYADPPWKFKTYSEKGKDRSADNHYPTMDLEDIMNLDVGDASMDDCVLFMWTTVPMLRQAFEVLEAWGFEYKSSWAWQKENNITGYWALNNHEILLIGTKGNIPAPLPGTQPLSCQTLPNESEHSAKPEIYRDIIEQMYPDLPKLEMFARGEYDGWDTWGNENA